MVWKAIHAEDVEEQVLLQGVRKEGQRKGYAPPQQGEGPCCARNPEVRLLRQGVRAKARKQQDVLSRMPAGP